MLVNKDGNGIEHELKVRASAEAECKAEFERIKARAEDMPGWLRKTFVGRWLVQKRLMQAWQAQNDKARHLMTLDRTIGVPHQKMASALYQEAASLRRT